MDHAQDPRRDKLILPDEEELPESVDPQCPVCRSDDVERTGLEHSINFGPTRAIHTCRACRRRFVLLRPRRR